MEVSNAVAGLPEKVPSEPPHPEEVKRRNALPGSLEGRALRTEGTARTKAQVGRMGDGGPPQFQKQEVSGSELAQWRVTPSEEQPVSLGHWTGLAATVGSRRAGTTAGW